MRTYERLNAEVVKFEAQDVITASTATVDCTCSGSCFWANYGATTVVHGAYEWKQNPDKPWEWKWYKISECGADTHNH